MPEKKCPGVRTFSSALRPLSPAARDRATLQSLEYLESIINTVREPLIALDQDLRVVKASRSFYDVFKVNPEETWGS